MDGQTYPAGTFYIPNGRGVESLVNTAASELGIDFLGVADAPEAGSMELGAGSDRLGGPLRRIHALRVDQTHVRRVRVPVFGGVPP